MYFSWNSFGPIHFQYSQSNQGKQTPLDLLFFHGFMGNSHDWSRIVQELEKLLAFPVNIYLFDLPGHGRSRFGKQEINLSAFLKLFHELENYYDITHPVYIGYSMGGRIALHLAHQRQKQTRGLFVESSSFGIVDPQERDERLQRDQHLFAEILAEENPMQRLALFRTFLHQWYDMDMFQGIKEDSSFHLMIAEKEKNNVAELQKALDIFSVGKHDHFWNKISTDAFPFFYLSGEKDISVFEIVHRLQEMQRLHLFVQRVQGASHNIHFQQPEVFSKILTSFLEGLNSPNSFSK